MSDNKVVDFNTLNRPRNKDGGSGGGDMEARVAKLESGVEYIQRDISEIKSDLKEFKGEVRGEFKSVRDEFKSVHAEFKNVRDELKEQRELHHKDFRIIFGALITVALGLAGLMAKGFGWL